MTFLEHLEELRARLVRSLAALVAGFVVAWSFHEEIFHFLTDPLRKAYPGVKFITTGPSEALVLYMKMACVVGIFLAAPYLLYQVWACVAPRRYAHAKSYAIPSSGVGSPVFRGRAAWRRD